MERDNLLEEALEVLRRIEAVRHCMMFEQIHDDVSVREVLTKFKADSIQLLAKDAQDRASAILAKSEQSRVSG